MMKVVEYLDIELDGIYTDDYPDFVDAFISSATALQEDGVLREATEDELDELNEDRDLVYGLVMDRLY